MAFIKIWYIKLRSLFERDIKLRSLFERGVHSKKYVAKFLKRANILTKFNEKLRYVKSIEHSIINNSSHIPSRISKSQQLQAILPSKYTI